MRFSTVVAAAVVTAMDNNDDDNRPTTAGGGSGCSETEKVMTVALIQKPFDFAGALILSPYLPIRRLPLPLACTTTNPSPSPARLV